MTITIRQATHKDAGKLTPLLHQLCALEEDFAFDEAKHTAGIQLLLDSPSACVLVAEVDGMTAGMCTGQIVISTAEGGPSVLVEDVVVDTLFRAAGIGRRLLNRLARWAARKGATRMQLLADLDNQNALKFYDRCGWSQTNMICLRTSHFPE